MRRATSGRILQSSMFNSLEKEFVLPNYVEAVVHAPPPKWPTSKCHGCHPVDPRVLKFIDITTTDDTSFPPDCSDFGTTPLSGRISKYIFSMLSDCSDDSMSPAS